MLLESHNRETMFLKTLSLLNKGPITFIIGSLFNSFHDRKVAEKRHKLFKNSVNMYFGEKLLSFLYLKGAFLLLYILYS
jgi:hypothetical protein